MPQLDILYHHVKPPMPEMDYIYHGDEAWLLVLFLTKYKNNKYRGLA